MTNENRPGNPTTMTATIDVWLPEFFADPQRHRIATFPALQLTGDETHQEVRLKLLGVLMSSAHAIITCFDQTYPDPRDVDLLDQLKDVLPDDE